MLSSEMLLRRWRYLRGGVPVWVLKNFSKTDWLEKPKRSAIPLMLMSLHSNSLRASAQMSSERWKRTVRPVIDLTMRER